MNEPGKPPKTDAELFVKRLTDVCRAFQVAGEIARRNQAQVIRLKDDLDAITKQLRQAQTFQTHDEAYAEVKKIALSEIKRSGELKINVIGIASSYSWVFWSSVLPTILRKHSEATCNLNLALIEPDLLSKSKAGENKSGEDWADKSRRRQDDLQRTLQVMEPALRTRYAVSLVYYNNIPHWHGVLINEANLLIGGCSWELDKKKKLNLRAGENPYRTYFMESDDGPEHISLFEDWFQYYTQNGRRCNLTISEG